MATQPDPFLTIGWAAIDWIEHYLVHGPGDVQGQPIELDDEFAAFIAKGYRVVPRTGARRVRRAFLSRPKGRSKSGVAGFIACFDSLGPSRFDHWAERGEVSDWGYEYEVGEPVGKPLVYAETLCVATEEGQAGNTYDGIHYVLSPESASPELIADYGRLDVGLTRINLPKKRGFIEPVTASNESKDGAKSTFIVADETHLWIPPAMGKFKLGKMHQTMVRNLLKRKIASGWMLETSTMYAEGEGSVAEGTHAYAKSLSGRRGGVLLFDHRQASEDYDLTNRRERVKALREAYGPAAAWMDLEAIADYWDDPQASEADFRRFWLNQPVPLAEPLPAVFGTGRWETCALPDGAKAPKPDGVTFGVARSVDMAWSSIGSAIPMGERFHLGPADRKRGHEWVIRGCVALREVHTSARFVIASQGPAAALIPGLQEALGIEAVIVAGTGDYSDACAQLFDRVQIGEVEHRNYPELNDAVEDAERKTLGDRWQFSRKNSDVSMLEAVTLALWGANQPEESELEPMFGFA